MKFAARFLVLSAAGLIFSAAVRAEDVAAPANPYTALVARNIFGLVPIPAAEPPPPPPVDPPPKITPNGIMRLFGKWQVLFKTPGKIKPGQPPKEESYVMGEAERQDEIVVKKIDDKAGVVTFENHGVIQELALVAAKSEAMPVAAPGGVPVPTLAGAGSGGLGGARFGRAARPNKNVTSSADVAQSQAGLGGGGAGGFNPSAANTENLSPEAQVLMIEKNRMDTQAQVDAGSLPPLPPTVLTPPDATGYGGSPLIVPNVPVRPNQP